MRARRLGTSVYRAALRQVIRERPAEGHRVAAETFRQIEASGVAPDGAAFRELATAQAELDGWAQGEATLRLMARVLPDEPVSTSAVNAILAAAFRRGEPDAALRIFQERVVAGGVRARSATYSIMGRGLIRCNRLEEAAQIAMRAAERGMPTPVLYATLLKELAARGNADRAAFLAERIPHGMVDLRLATTIAAVHFQVGNADAACALYEQMLERGTVDDRLQHVVATQLYKAGRVEDVRRLFHDRAEYGGGRRSEHVRTVVARALTELGEWDGAEALLPGLRMRTWVFYLKQRTKFDEQLSGDDVEQLVERLLAAYDGAERVQPLRTTAIAALARAGRVKAAEDIFEAGRETADIVACHALLSAYLRCSDGAGATAFLASTPVDETEFTPHTHTLAAKARALAQTPAHDAWT